MIKLKNILKEQSNIGTAATAAQNVELRKQRDDLYWNKMSDEQRFKFNRMKEKYYSPDAFERELSKMGWRKDLKSAQDLDGRIIFNHRNEKEMIPIRWKTIYDTKYYDKDNPGPWDLDTLDDDFVTFNGKHYDLVKGLEETLVYKLSKLSIELAGTKEIPWKLPKY